MNEAAELGADLSSSPGVRTRVDPRTGKLMLLQPESFWREHEERRTAAGMSVSEYCEQHQLALSTFRRWSRRFAGQEPQGPGSAQAGFLSMPIRSAASSSSTAAVLGNADVEIETGNGVRVRLYGGAAARVVEAVLARLGSAP